MAPGSKICQENKMCLRYISAPPHKTKTIYIAEIIFYGSRLEKPIPLLQPTTSLIGLCKAPLNVKIIAEKREIKLYETLV